MQQGEHRVCVHEPTLSLTIVGKGFELEGSPPGPYRKGSGESLGARWRHLGLGFGLSLQGSKGASGLTAVCRVTTFLGRLRKQSHWKKATNTAGRSGPGHRAHALQVVALKGLNDNQLPEGWVVAWPQAEEGLTEMGGAPPPRGIPRRRDVLGGKVGVGQREMFWEGQCSERGRRFEAGWRRQGWMASRGGWRRSREAGEEVLGHPRPARPLPFS